MAGCGALPEERFLQDADDGIGRRDAIMYHMRKATLRDLRYRFGVVEDLLQHGEEIQITRRRRVIARLLPPAVPAAAPRPDFAKRLQRIYGDKTMRVSGTELLAEDRSRG